MAMNKEDFLKEIEEMKVIELYELVEAIKERFNVTAAVAVAAAAAPAGGDASAEEEKTEFTVVLVSFDDSKKINVIKEVKSITGLSLKEAKDAVEAGGSTIKEGVNKEEAEAIKKQLETAGGKVEVK